MNDKPSKSETVLESILRGLVVAMAIGLVAWVGLAARELAAPAKSSVVASISQLAASASAAT